MKWKSDFQKSWLIADIVFNSTLIRNTVFHVVYNDFICRKMYCILLDSQNVLTRSLWHQYLKMLKVFNTAKLLKVCFLVWYRECSPELWTLWDAFNLLLSNGRDSCCVGPDFRRCVTWRHWDFKELETFFKKISEWKSLKESRKTPTFFSVSRSCSVEQHSSVLWQMQKNPKVCRALGKGLVLTSLP